MAVKSHLRAFLKSAILAFMQSEFSPLFQSTTGFIHLFVSDYFKHPDAKPWLLDLHSRHQNI